MNRESNKLSIALLLVAVIGCGATESFTVEAEQEEPGRGDTTTGGQDGLGPGGQGGQGGGTADDPKPPVPSKPPAGSMTITGTGFGTKAKPGPVLFDDFEGGDVGTQIQNRPAVVGTWQTGAGSDSPVYSDTVVREGGRSSKHPFTSTQNSSLSLNVDFTKAYVDYWTYAAPVSASEPSGLSRNWKPFRLYGDNDVLQAGITTMLGFTSNIGYFDPIKTSYFGGEWPRKAWVHIQFWLKLNDVGQSNGTFRARWNNYETVENNLQMRTSASQRMNQVRIGHYWAHDAVSEWPYTNPGANIYVDSVYFDTSWARVEIGNADTYAASTHREIQLVTSWSDTEVTFTVQRGTLPSGPAWVFVFDENNQLRATKPITL